MRGAKKLLTKIIDGNKDKETEQFYANNRQFFRKFLPQFTKHLVISDSTSKFVKQGNKSSETAIQSYPSTTICIVNDIMDSYSDGTKPESIVFRLGHNAIDRGTDGKKAAEQLDEFVSKFFTNFKPHNVAICQIRLVKNELCVTRTTHNLMSITKKSTALLFKLEAYSSGPMNTSSVMVLGQTISHKVVSTQTCMNSQKKLKHCRNR